MRHLRVHVGPEAVLVVLYGGPERRRALVGELEAHDALDVLEAVFPRRREPQRRAVLLPDRLAVESARDEGEFVARAGHGGALDVGPGVQGGALADGGLR